MNGSWIRMDVGSLFDDKLIQLRQKHGLAGEGAFWSLIRILAQNEGKASRGAVTTLLSSLDSQANVIAMLEVMLELGLIRCDKQILFSPRLSAELEFAENKSERRKEAGRKGGLAKSLALLKHRPTDLPTNLPTNRPTKTAIQPDGWTEWWALYPRKVAKGAALKAYGAAVKAGHLPATLKDGVSRSVTWWRVGGIEPQFIPHPATWLRQERWNDEAPAPPRAKDGMIEATAGKNYGKSGKL